MNNSALLLLLITLLGISLLLTSSLFSKPLDLSISEISLKHLNKEIKITASIINIKQIPKYNLTILTLQSKTKTINATFYKILNKTNLNSKKITLTGKLVSYKGELQIKVKKIIF
jgi:hypothetical protein